MNDNKTVAIVAIIAVAAVLITATAISQDTFAKCKKKQSQSIAQANSCSFSKCQNLASQIQGDGNAVNVIDTQNQPEVD
jgi:hypothetical protein